MEQENLEMQNENQQDAFLEGWEDTDTPEQTETESEVPEEPAEKADPEQEPEKGTEPEAEKAETAGAAAPQSWSVKHLGEERKISTDDITPELLQKGLDYDRIRSKYDEAKPGMEFLTETAKKMGMSVEDYIHFVRVETKKNAGMGEDEAKRTVALEDREAAVAKKETAAEEGADDAASRIQADIAEFAKAFPEIYKSAKDDPKVIPQSVWDAVNAGELTLTAAYAKYAIAQAEEKAETAIADAKADIQNRENASRSTGSMQSAGNSRAGKDAFLEGFDD